jgi:hypothetical protein
MISIDHIPGEERHSDHAAVLRTRLNTAWQHYVDRSGLQGARLHVSSTGPQPQPNRGADGGDGGPQRRGDRSRPAEDRIAQYVPSRPLYDLSRLIVPQATLQQLLLAASVIAHEKLVFDEWGLRAIQPYPRSALNLHGAPGTGKSLAAHALASHLGVDILQASYAQIESMYHGEGPKNVVALFQAAEQAGALLFLDEADSLLSRRLTSVTQGSEQAINSMRSQLLICMEAFRGVVVFATNLIENYDPAFETRVRSIEFLPPDRDCRLHIWRAHLPPKLPLADDVDVTELAAIESLSGREIRNAVVDAAVQAAAAGRRSVVQRDMLEAVERIVGGRYTWRSQAKVHELSPEEQRAVEAALRPPDAAPT